MVYLSSQLQSQQPRDAGSDRRMAQRRCADDLVDQSGQRVMVESEPDDDADRPGAMNTAGTCSVVSPSSKTTTIASRPAFQSGPDISTGIQERRKLSASASVPSCASSIRLGVMSPTFGSVPRRTSEASAPPAVVPAGTSSARQSPASLGKYAQGL